MTDRLSPLSIASFTTQPIRVTYADTDRMDHVYHANYLVWFEMARIELLRSLGQEYKSWEDDQNIFLPVRRCSVDYMQPARFDDQIIVHVDIVHLTRATIGFAYRLFRQSDNALLATAATDHIFVRKDGRIVRAGDKLLPQLFRKEVSRDSPPQ